MAGLPVVYPDTLPHPEVGQFTPRERRAINREFMRPISRDRAGTRSVAFTFTPVQAREFREWYHEWVTMGGGMFAASWPMPWGRGPHVFRFVEPPTWQLIGGGIDGQGYWRVTADVELRGRGEMPTLEVFTVTSKPYPIEDVEAGSVGPVYYRPYPAEVSIEEAKLFGFALMDGDLREPIVYASAEDEAGVIGFEVLDGELKAPLVSFSAPREDGTLLDFSMIDGELRVVLISYQNWPGKIADESATISNFELINGSLA